MIDDAFKPLAVGQRYIFEHRTDDGTALYTDVTIAEVTFTGGGYFLYPKNIPGNSSRPGFAFFRADGTVRTADGDVVGTLTRLPDAPSAVQPQLDPNREYVFASDGGILLTGRLRSSVDAATMLFMPKDGSPSIRVFRSTGRGHHLRHGPGVLRLVETAVLDAVPVNVVVATSPEAAPPRPAPRDYFDSLRDRDHFRRVFATWDYSTGTYGPCARQD